MKKFINWLKNARPLKIATVFVLGFFLLFTQSCSAKGIAAQPPQQKAESAYIERYDPTKEYPLNTPKGGMNNFSDVDPRSEVGEKTAETQAKALRDNAKRNVDEKGIDSTEQYVRNYRQGTPFGERVKNLGEDIGSSAEEVREGVVKGTQRGLENIKENTQNAGEDLVKKGKQTTGND
ncbi:hypothetical protein [Nostoc parmelioides]|uniref:Uncharacterized protein n=1 Tax=Nostoc parmelioides FACHB-3921 TaxID=2692909 RepID=A0ABR8BAK0_9NOSO|nr:hypothetical protein [Nostoc parmelioides]MBD2251113.1 hypothetical protein [Nostoc parmelioides FACHB-3921]